MKQDYKKIIQMIFFPAVVFGFNQLVLLPLDLYTRFPWLDIPMHLIGGMSIGAGSIFLLRYLQERSLLKRVEGRLVYFWVIGCVGFSALMWEFYEFVFDYFFHTAMQLGPIDMAGDLFFGLVGGYIAGRYLSDRFGVYRK